MANFSFQVQEPIKTLKSINLDYWQGPWVGSTLALAISKATSSIPVEIRYQGMKVILAVRAGATETEYDPKQTYTILQYWFKDDKTTLVPFTPDKDVNALGTAAGSTGEIQFNKDGALSASSGLTFDTTKFALTSSYVVASAGFSGSLTRLTDGTSYLREGTNISIVTGSKGEVTISSNAVTNPAGSNTQIQFNNNNAFGASSNLTFNTSTNTLTSNTVVATSGITGSLTRLPDGTRYLRAGDNVTITTGSGGWVEISSSMPTGGVTWNGPYANNQMLTADGLGRVVSETNLTFNGTNNLNFNSTAANYLTHLGASPAVTNKFIISSSAGNVEISAPGTNAVVKVENTTFDANQVTVPGGITGSAFQASDFNNVLKNQNGETVLKLDSTNYRTAVFNYDIEIAAAGTENYADITTTKLNANIFNDTVTQLNLGAGTTANSRINIGSYNANQSNTTISGSVKIIGNKTTPSLIVTSPNSMPGGGTSTDGVVGLQGLGTNAGSTITFGTVATPDLYGKIGNYGSNFFIDTSRDRDIVFRNKDDGIQLLLLSSSNAYGIAGTVYTTGDLVVGSDPTGTNGDSADIFTYKNTINLGGSSPNLNTFNLGKAGTNLNLNGTVSLVNAPAASTSTQILTRNSTNGNIEYADASTNSSITNLGVIYAMMTYNYLP